MKRQVYLMILAVVTATGMLLGTFAHLGHGRAFGFLAYRDAHGGSRFDIDADDDDDDRFDHDDDDRGKRFNRPKHGRRSSSSGQSSSDDQPEKQEQEKDSF